MAAYARVPDVMDRSGCIASGGCEALLAPASLAPALARMGAAVSCRQAGESSEGCGWCFMAYDGCGWLTSRSRASREAEGRENAVSPRHLGGGCGDSSPGE